MSGNSQMDREDRIAERSRVSYNTMTDLLDSVKEAENELDKFNRSSHSRNTISQKMGALKLKSALKRAEEELNQKRIKNSVFFTAIYELMLERFNNSESDQLRLEAVFRFRKSLSKNKSTGFMQDSYFDDRLPEDFSPITLLFGKFEMIFYESFFLTGCRAGVLENLLNKDFAGGVKKYHFDRIHTIIRYCEDIITRVQAFTYDDDRSEVFLYWVINFCNRYIVYLGAILDLLTKIKQGYPHFYKSFQSRLEPRDYSIKTNEISFKISSLQSELVESKNENMAIIDETDQFILKHKRGRG